MANQQFYQNTGPYSLGKISEILGISVPEQYNDILVHEVKGLSEAGKNDLSFLNNRKYLKDFKNTKARVCIIPEDVDIDTHDSAILIKVKNPYFAYAKIIDLFYLPTKKQAPQIASTTQIAKSAKLGKNCYIGHNVVIEDEVHIGDNAVIEANSFIDYGVTIGNNARIDSNVSICHAQIGDNVVILSGARIGQDGFGFATEGGIHKKIYHIGSVVIGNDVEIGANTTIDRGSMGNTTIEDLCRIDNLVQIGHNVHIKKGSIIVAQVGIAGSSTVGSYCALGGQVGVAGHVTIADQVQIAGQGGVSRDVKESGIYGGSPIVPIRNWHKQTIILNKLINEKRK